MVHRRRKSESIKNTCLGYNMELKSNIIAERIKELTKEVSIGPVVSTLVTDMVLEYEQKIQKLEKEVAKLCKRKPQEVQ